MTAHLVLGDASAETLRRAGVGPVLVLRDLLSVGRSDADPARHRAARVAQWKIDDAEADEGILEPRALSAALDRVDGPLVLWTSPTWPSRLYEWSTIDWLASLGFDFSRVERTEIDRHFTAIPAALEARAPIDLERVACARELWRAFVASTPLAFDALRLRGSPAYPDLRETCEGFGACFPRREGKLRLSYFDELLLDGLGEAWTAQHAIFRGPRGGELADGPLGWFGDTNLYARLEQLRAHGALERDDVSYRLTSLGLRLLDEGASTLSDFAPLDLGGFRLNNPACPYVREADGDGWRIVRG